MCLFSKHDTIVFCQSLERSKRVTTGAVAGLWNTAGGGVAVTAPGKYLPDLRCSDPGAQSSPARQGARLHSTVCLRHSSPGRGRGRQPWGGAGVRVTSAPPGAAGGRGGGKGRSCCSAVGSSPGCFLNERRAEGPARVCVSSFAGTAGRGRQAQGTGSTSAGRGSGWSRTRVGGRPRCI